MYILAILLFLTGIVTIIIMRNDLFKPVDAFGVFEKADHFKPKVAAADFFQLEGYDLVRALVMPLQYLMKDSIQPEVTLKRFSPEQKALYFWWMMDGELNNGGFENYFMSNQSQYLPSVKTGLKLTGDDKLLGLLAQAELIFKKNKGRKTDKKDFQGLNTISDWATYSEVDAQYLSLAKNTMGLFEKMVKTSPSDFCSDTEGDDIDPMFTGILRIFYETDTLKEEIPIVNGLIEGERKTWFVDGQPSNQQTWKAGRQMGNQKGWFPNGQLQFSETYSDEGLFAEYWFDNGNKKKEERFDAQKHLHGIQKTWHDNGTLAEEISYINGNPDGPFLQFNKNGKKKLEAEFREGKAFYRNYWNEKGKQLLKDGNGVYIFEPQTMLSVLRRETVLKDFKKDGITKEFMDGILVSSTEYQEDQKHGKTFLYYNDGSVRQESIYEKGKLISSKDFPPKQKATQ